MEIKAQNQGSSESKGEIVVGVLALQGAFIEHVEIFENLGIKVQQVRLPQDLEGLTGLVIPGGESTAIGLIADRWGLTEPLQSWVKEGRPTWGTCAGMIMLSKTVTGKMKEGQMVLGGLDTVVHRNFFGSQLGSFVADVKVQNISGEVFKEKSSCQAVFIRAPIIKEHGESVKVLATIKDPTLGSVEADATAATAESIVAVQQGNLLATSFHPEMTSDTRWHEYFVHMIKQL
mmetsp:Transcript_1641/g.1985  ORF Transcript_1641/g.1985 Transcript_1641/m.1985 type:complete len:232 (+) Transcript_1641:198-893(+)|eukprot:CAMPEP_0184032830 /NCGR_PEP_ID=MMETSP0955-20130417/3331_1 /TAXON_ID=627963 /ORGANISM="Aplanochytrium sp, Strain PBS07" /LENGTH=231 /DNA_ID=CAMNT_0026319023 /DNA_START=116 /DNA_END=811 /DNA_ORIENTATION=+